MKITELSVPVRVRYVECDPMNVAHHSVYPVWFEMARTELLRQQGEVYREMEAGGVLFVVARMNVRYHRPAMYDDELTIHVKALPSAGVKIEHEYKVYRDGVTLTSAETTLACVDRDGKLRAIPASLAIESVERG
ncbi:acyl-CoA thioesterase [Phycisphaerales bacterium AB-hyl4]|uniref:Acyl-CoA thioesterase n=1 Tax=Natronomicrosphaera hydrolytica TaxID=3242702 RepID=A0ABV4U9P1_9BACT